jgi:hypothetical protein
MSDLFYRSRVSNAETEDCEDVLGNKSFSDALDMHSIASPDIQNRRLNKFRAHWSLENRRERDHGRLLI